MKLKNARILLTGASGGLGHELASQLSAAGASLLLAGRARSWRGVLAGAAITLLSLTPIVIGLAAIPMLDEALTSWLMGGLLLVSLGAYLASQRA